MLLLFCPKQIAEKEKSISNIIKLITTKFTNLFLLVLIIFQILYFYCNFTKKITGWRKNRERKRE
jgi:ABC-type transport system involved in Fe-S cluster assembly fused permease/ATPase subunit